MSHPSAPRFLAIFSTIFLAFNLPAGRASTFSAYYAFGDSLSDTGRNPATPAGSYYNGRYSNGPLWVEYLSAELGLAYNASNNFAFSGSETSNLLSQITNVPASPALHTALFSVLSGGNDFLDNASLGENDLAWDLVVTDAVSNITLTVTTLYTNGAREVIVGTLPNVGQTPAFNGSPAGYAGYVDSKVALFNFLLQSAITNAVQHDAGLRVYLADFNASLSNVLSAPAAYGFTVTTNGALEDPNLADKSFNGPGANYVFWDLVHPTTKMHALIGAAAFACVGVQVNLARSGTNFNLNLNNLYPGYSYAIQSSSNLTTWATAMTFTSSLTNSVMSVTNKSNRQVFYRVSY
ncbi:MAG TPA: SGNH/GDSL hydrolase family protein [Verrucomicrobiae bacterium]|nr:SGNH/GDSL hydrolase family protein [Verrucomicrobiae bacterium]